MSNPFSISSPPQPSRSRRRRMGWTVRITPAGVLILVLLNLLLIAGWAYGISRVTAKPDALGLSGNPSETVAQATGTIAPPTSTTPARPTASATVPAIDTATTSPITPSPLPVGTLALNQGLIILALDEGGNTHLFAYQPEETGQPLPLSRLTYGPWDDIAPAISPDGLRVAFASNRSGYWDIYVMELSSGGITRLTDTLEYEGAPTWSPDSKWLIYEAYVNDNLELKIHPFDNTSAPILLTDNPAADFSPAWSPQGRQIVFVSNRSGEDEIWLADLDKSEEQRFQDISQNSYGKDSHPAWSPDGTSLLWVSEQDGLRNIYLNEAPSKDAASGTPSAMSKRNLGSGDWPVWSADGEAILTILQAPNHTYLTAYRARHPGLVLPAVELPGFVQGLSWGNVTLTSPLQEVYQQAMQAAPTPLYASALGSSLEGNGSRYQLTPLDGVEAPNPYLHDEVDESFRALRTRLASELGWDFLSSLENAYVPLTAPLDPGMGNDWLYTGRAIALNSVPMSAGWMVATREDFGAETYWHIYVRPLYQDGSAGTPLHDLPWDFDARHNGDTIKYELGGAELASIPEGYWIDFTVRAHAYGWERLPALAIWRASFPAARFNEFAWIGTIDWHSAMLQLYPPESMITPSPVYPPTRTPTRTSRWYESPTPTVTPSPRPTHTPFPLMPSDAPSAPGD